MTPDTEHLLKTDSLLKALADPTRRAIYEHLSRGGELPVHVLTEAAGVSQPAVSKHLNMLKQSDLVEERRAGRQTFYRARPQGLMPLIDWIGVYGRYWEGRIDALENLLDRMDQ